MTRDQINQVVQCSSGTIAHMTGIRTYTEIDGFVNWVCENGEQISYGANAMAALYNAALGYKGGKR